MKLLYPSSLAATVDAINDAYYHQTILSTSEKEQAAVWIAERQGLPGSYADLFAPTKADFTKGMRVYTGETIGAGGGARHIIGQEACRALLLLDVPETRPILQIATRSVADFLSKVHESGIYCCSKCSIALWRHLIVSDMPDAEERLTNGIAVLRAHRLGEGDWSRFPFYYTLLALREIDLPSSHDEIIYAAPRLERKFRLLKGPQKYAKRRRWLAEQILAYC